MATIATRHFVSRWWTDTFNGLNLPPKYVNTGYIVYFHPTCRFLNIILPAIGLKFGKYIQTNRVRVHKKRLKSLLLSPLSFETFERKVKMASQWVRRRVHCLPNTLFKTKLFKISLSLVPIRKIQNSNTKILFTSVVLPKNQSSLLHLIDKLWVRYFQQTGMIELE